MTGTRTRWLAIVAAALALGACGGDNSTASTTTTAAAAATTAPSAPTSGGSSSTVFEQGHIDAGLTSYIDLAVADLAAHLGVPASAVTPLSAVVVVWPDGSLGCPEPGMMYTQVTVDGALIELGVNGAVYRYHSGGSTKPFLCEQPLSSPPPTGDS